MNKQEHVSLIYINAAIDRVWAALTQPEFTEQYFHMTKVESDWQQGSAVYFYNQDDSIAVEGRVLEAEAPNKLSISWHVLYNVSAKKEPPSRVTFSLEQQDNQTKLTVHHNQFPEETVVFEQIDKGWIEILSKLKILLETNPTLT